ncbi:MAG: hypothetical protein KME64_00340 [Scytonematopsis contorta HA4267-MV1]|jgi:hypothetical protein|nr:hypothetical protein [Scytonematopsis contorta HA4267-MV1]
MKSGNRPDDDIKRSKGKFDFVNDPRQWSIAASEANCRKLAKAKGKRLVEIIDTEDDLLPIVCIFEDYKNE